MQIKEYPLKYITKNCLTCQIEFQAPLKEVNRGNGKYCSKECSANSKRGKIKVVPNLQCAVCETPIYRSPSKKQNSKHGFFFCSRICKDKAQTIDSECSIKEIMPPHFGIDVSKKYRSTAFRHKEEKCERCGFDAYPILEVHHKDRNRKNNFIENLEVLCPNCHSVEHYLARDGKWSRKYNKIMVDQKEIESSADRLQGVLAPLVHAGP